MKWERGPAFSRTLKTTPNTNYNEPLGQKTNPAAYEQEVGVICIHSRYRNVTLKTAIVYDHKESWQALVGNLQNHT
jgi:hypothetical protein